MLAVPEFPVGQTFDQDINAFDFRRRQDALANEFEKAWPVGGDLGVFEESFVLSEVCVRPVAAAASSRGDEHSHHDQEKTDQTTKQAEHENLLRSLSVLRCRPGDDSSDIVSGPMPPDE